MLHILENPKKILNDTFVLFISIFVGLRILSFLSFSYQTVQAGLVLLFLLVFVIFYFYHPKWAWIIILSEFLLGGAGHFFEFYGVSLRTLLVVLFVVLWSTTRFIHTKYKPDTNPPLVPSFLIIILLVYIALTSFLALYYGHRPKTIIQDSLPFLVFLLLPASYQFLKEKKVQENLIRLIASFIFGSFLFSLFNIILFSTNFAKIHGIYYKWFRDVAMGKITYMAHGFYRIVAPEHLLIVIPALICLALLMKHRVHFKKILMLFFLFCAFVMVLNFSRAYFLGFIAGLLVLKYKNSLKNWGKAVVFGLLSIFILFTGTYFITSGGKSFGLKLFNARAASVVMVDTEESTTTRMELIKPILNTILINPILGTGLGASITFYNPIKQTQITTTNFDWGYLEMLAEIGIVGTLIILVLVFFIVQKLIKKIQIIQSDYKNIYVGNLAAVAALLVINITTPALFHTLGIFYLIVLLSISSQSVTVWEKIEEFFQKIL